MAIIIVYNYQIHFLGISDWAELKIVHYFPIQPTASDLIASPNNFAGFTVTFDPAQTASTFHDIAKKIWLGLGPTYYLLTGKCAKNLFTQN